MRPSVRRGQGCFVDRWSAQTREAASAPLNAGPSRLQGPRRAMRGGVRLGSRVDRLGPGGSEADGVQSAGGRAPPLWKERMRGRGGGRGRGRGRSLSRQAERFFSSFFTSEPSPPDQSRAYAPCISSLRPAAPPPLLLVHQQEAKKNSWRATRARRRQPRRRRPMRLARRPSRRARPRYEKERVAQGNKETTGQRRREPYDWAAHAAPPPLGPTPTRG